MQANGRGKAAPPSPRQAHACSSRRHIQVPERFCKPFCDRYKKQLVILALGVLPDCTRDILGLWIDGSEGPKFWMRVFNDLKTRGVNDILIAVTDGLKGMPKALGAVFPATTLQTCIVHLIRNSLDYANWKEHKALAAAIRPIYTAASAEQKQNRLTHKKSDTPPSWGRSRPRKRRGSTLHVSTVYAAWELCDERIAQDYRGSRTDRGPSVHSWLVTADERRT